MGKKKRKKQCDSVINDSASKVVVSLSEPPTDLKHIFIIALIAVVVYSNTFFMDFVSDDLYQIKENKLITSLRNIPDFFTTEVWKGVKGSDNITPYYRPLFTLSYAIDYFIWGTRPLGYHLTNVFLHMLVSVLVYILSLKILRSKTAAFLSASVFSVHPVHAEAVTWIAARNESLAALFMLLSLYIYILFRETRKVSLLGISLILFFLGLLSKEMAVTLPLLIFLEEAYFRHGTWKDKIKWSVLYGLILIPYFIIRQLVLEVSTWQQVPILWRIYTGFVILFKYTILLILPINLKVYYNIPIEKTLSEPRVLLAISVLTFILLFIILIKRYDRRLSFSMLWIYVTAIPVSGIPTLIWPAPMAERYLYIPSVGFALSAGLCLSMLLNKASGEKVKGSFNKGANLVKMLSATLIIFLFILNFQRNYAWKDQFNYAKMVVKDAPDSETGHNDLGVEYAKRGDIKNAIEELSIAIKIKPDFPEALSNLSALLRRQKRYNEAISVLKESLRIKPRNPSALNNLGLVYTDLGRLEDAVNNFTEALKIESGYPEIHNNLGVVYLQQGQFDKALSEFEIAFRLDPRYPEAHNNKGVIYLKKGMIDEAKKEFQNALSLRPGYKEALDNLTRASQMLTEESVNLHYNRGNEFLSQQRFLEAIAEYRIALKQKPDDAEIYNNIGAAYMKLGRLEDAEREFKNALKFRSKDARIHYNIGVLYMKQGKLNESIKHLQTSINLKPDSELFKNTLKMALELKKRT